MISRRVILSGLGALPLVHLGELNAHAHKEKYSLTQLIWNEGSDQLTVTHSYHMHDAEQALAASGIIEKPDLTSLKARARLALYTAEHFRISGDTSQIELTIVGAEIDRGKCYVYQEGVLSNFPEILTIECAMFRPLIPGQINNVDVRKNGKTTSLKFSGNDGAKIMLA